MPQKIAFNKESELVDIFYRTLPKLALLLFFSIILFSTDSTALSKSQKKNRAIAARYAPRKMPAALSIFPRDKYGLIDWAEAARIDLLDPLPSLTGQPEDKPYDKDVLIYSKRKFFPNVLFPHKIHNYWLSCKVCHTSLSFAKKAGGTKKLSMARIFKGEFCGRCHDRVAFPIRECYRCHIKRKKK